MKGLKFQTEPNPGPRPFHEKKEKYTPHTTPFAAFLKQENVNMVIFSTCFKTDHFSEREKDSKRGRHKREAEKEKKKYEKKKSKKSWPTHDIRPPQICVCVPVCAMRTGCGFLCLHTVPPRALRWCRRPWHAAERRTGSIPLWVYRVNNNLTIRKHFTCIVRLCAEAIFHVSKTGVGR